MPFGIKIEDYSSIKKLTRTTAWVFRFINNIKQETKIKGELISEEIIHAEVTWIKAIQKETYLKILSCNKTNKTDDVRKLNLKIDHDGIIRCYG